MRITTTSLLIILIHMNVTIFGQIVEAKADLLLSIPIGESAGKLRYLDSNEGLFGPSGPFIDDKGILYFIDTTTYSRLQVFSEGSFSDLAFPNGWGEDGNPTHDFRSQQGSTLGGFGRFVLNDHFVYEDFWEIIGASKLQGLSRGVYYPAPWGCFIEYKYNNEKDQLFSLEKDKTGNYAVRNLKETREWLNSTGDSFQIGVDGLIYRDRKKWSAITPKELVSQAPAYIGRLASGHVIWGGGLRGMDRTFRIATPGGQIELIIEVMWAPRGSPQGYRPYTYCLGPWGEFYAMIAPHTNAELWPPKDSFSDLVVIRNHLQYFGRLNDGGVSLRKKPSISAESFGSYPVKTGFRILEKGIKEETIAGQRSVWYKVRLLDGKEGWFFGAFVHNLYDGPNGKAPPWPNVPDW